MYAGTELSWIGGVEAVHRCATKRDCSGIVLCGGNHPKVGCVDGKCVCVPTDDTSDAIIIDPPTSSPSAGGAELSWMGSGAEEINQHCASDADCYRSEKKCRGGLIAVCVDGRCTCIHVDAYDIPIITDPPVLSPSAGDENEDVDHASPTPAIP